ncbi:hypothetical protein ES705_30319 [subsurface metagenome]
MTDKKTYEDFGIILEKLKNDRGSAYERIGIEINMNPSTLQRMAKTRAVKLPDYDVMEKVARYFHLEPHFFYEYRLRKFLDYVDNNRKFLDHCLRQAKRLTKKISDKPEEALEDFEKIEEELEEKRGEI